jgi:hypothetical protein
VVGVECQLRAAAPTQRLGSCGALDVGGLRAKRATFGSGDSHGVVRLRFISRGRRSVFVGDRGESVLKADGFLYTALAGHHQPAVASSGDLWGIHRQPLAVTQCRDREQRARAQPPGLSARLLQGEAVAPATRAGATSADLTVILSPTQLLLDKTRAPRPSVATRQVGKCQHSARGRLTTPLRILDQRSTANQESESQLREQTRNRNGGSKCVDDFSQWADLRSSR